MKFDDDINTILREADVMGLIKSGAPINEYMGEAKLISGRISVHPAPTVTAVQEILFNVFTNQFYPLSVGKFENYENLATKIKKVIDGV